MAGRFRFPFLNRGVRHLESVLLSAPETVDASGGGQLWPYRRDKSDYWAALLAARIRPLRVVLINPAGIGDGDKPVPSRAMLLRQFSLKNLSSRAA